LQFFDVKCFVTVYIYTVTRQVDVGITNMKDEKKTKSQLIDDPAAMRRRITEMETLQTGDDFLQEKLHKLEHDLRERNKELACLYAIADVVEKSDSVLEEILQGIINQIPAAFQYPEIACGRIINGTQEFRTDNFRETAFKMSSDIRVRKDCVGAIETFYLEERMECDEGPFLKEERYLIDAVAERLGKIIERITIVAVLKESENNYRSIFENAVEGIYQSTPEGRFLSVNPALARMMGFTSPEEMVTAYTDIGEQHYANPEDRKLFKELIERDGIIKAFETKLHKKDGSIIWTSRSGRVVRDAAGKVLYYEGTVEDITKHRKAEEEKRNNEKLSAALEMAGTICHEMNQPLQVLSGRIDLLSMGHMDERMYKSLEIMKDQVRKMGIITKKLMGLKTYSTYEYTGTTRITDINSETDDSDM
jgi:PAS domain S-box-containing protein